MTNLCFTSTKQHSVKNDVDEEIARNTIKNQWKLCRKSMKNRLPTLAEPPDLAPTAAGASGIRVRSLWNLFPKTPEPPQSAWRPPKTEIRPPDAGRTSAPGKQLRESGGLTLSRT